MHDIREDTRTCRESGRSAFFYSLTCGDEGGGAREVPDLQAGDESGVALHAILTLCMAE